MFFAYLLMFLGGPFQQDDWILKGSQKQVDSKTRGFRIVEQRAGPSRVPEVSFLRKCRMHLALSSWDPSGPGFKRNQHTATHLAGHPLGGLLGLAGKALGRLTGPQEVLSQFPCRWGEVEP